MIHPFPQWHLLTPLGNKPFENTVGKGEIARHKQFLLFPQCFLPICRTFCHCHHIWNCRLQTLWNWTCLKFCRLIMGLGVVPSCPTIQGSCPRRVESPTVVCTSARHLLQFFMFVRPGTFIRFWRQNFRQVQFETDCRRHFKIYLRLKNNTFLSFCRLVKG